MITFVELFGELFFYGIKFYIEVDNYIWFWFGM